MKTAPWHLLLLAPSLAWGLGRVRFGSEMTFYDPNIGVMTIKDYTKRIIPTGINFINRMRSHLIENQAVGQKFTETTNHSLRQSLGRFTSPNGWWYEWGYDDSVVEVKLLPESPKYFRQYKADMQDAIYVSAANENLWPAMFLGGGHINLGMTAFDGNPLLLRNFVVDLLFNHNELFLGVFNYDTNNAASLYVQSEKVRLDLLAIIEKFDRGGYADEDDIQVEFTKAIDGVLQNERDPIFQRWETGGSRREYSAVNFSHVDEGAAARIELRGVRPQASMDVWVNQIELLENRLLFLEKIDRPIPIAAEVPVEPLDLDHHLLNPPIDAELALKAFYKYVTESGSEWKNNREYLWPKWISDGEVDRFEASEFFIKSEHEFACAKDLKGK